jgi:DNA-repair protein complementing XP-A cells
MVNSKGGFLVSDGGNVDMDLIRKEKERELQRNIHNLDLREYYFLSLH